MSILWKRNECYDTIYYRTGIHYSSQHANYEDESKKSSKSIPVKLLVFASCAQLGVDAGNEEIMGDRNGIR